MANLSVSLVVTSRDESFLSHTLEVLRPQCEALNAECIVVDSSLGRLQAIADANPWVRWIDYVPQIPKSRTVPHQRNVGCLAARSPIIAFCDAGGEPDPAWLAQLVAPLLAGEAQATAGPIRPLRPGTYPVLNDLPFGATVPTVMTGNFAFTFESFQRAGGFDERYEYGEDTEFGWRLRDIGLSVFSVPDAIMTVDWGSIQRHLRRRILDGKGKARQFVLLPAYRLTIFARGVVIRSLSLMLLMVLSLAALIAYQPWLGFFGLLFFSCLIASSLRVADTRFDSAFTKVLRAFLYRVLYLLAFLSELISRRSLAYINLPRNDLWQEK